MINTASGYTPKDFQIVKHQATLVGVEKHLREMVIEKYLVIENNILSPS